ncbi:MAG: NAD(P)-dependent alcohol dehydrogenase [Acidimicrobiales bacterium]
MSKAQMMKASVRHAYGPREVLHVEEVKRPAPRDDELLVRIHAASVNLGDWELLTAKPLYITILANIFGPKPRNRPVSPDNDDTTTRRKLLAPKYKVLGTDFAGLVEAVGKDVTRYQAGDEVFGQVTFGAFSEYACVSEDADLALKPATMSFEIAAATPEASFIALTALRDKADLRAGQTVLINGAGGGAGSCAVRLAKHYGAEVTGVDNTEKLDFMRSIGADHVIDFTAEDFTQNGERYDVILDLAAYRSVFQSRRSLKPGGIYLMAGGSGKTFAQSLLFGPLLSRAGQSKIAFLMANSSSDKLALMAELFEAGTIIPTIDRSYPLTQAGAAIQRLGEKQSLGKVIVTP